MQAVTEKMQSRNWREMHDQLQHLICGPAAVQVSSIDQDGTATGLEDRHFSVHGAVKEKKFDRGQERFAGLRHQK